MTDSSPSPAGASPESLPSPDGLPRRHRKPEAANEAALADALEAEFEAVAEESTTPEPEIEETLRERGARLSALRPFQ